MASPRLGPSATGYFTGNAGGENMRVMRSPTPTLALPLKGEGIVFLPHQGGGKPIKTYAAFNPTSTSSSIFLASPNSMRLLSL